MKTIQIETDEYRVMFAAFSGLGAYAIAEHCSELEARTELDQLARRRKKTGHVVTELEPGKYEFCEPEDSMLIPDTAGIAWIERHTVPGAECWDCGFPVAYGEICSCHDIDPEIEELETDDQEDQ